MSTQAPFQRFQRNRVEDRGEYREGRRNSRAQEEEIPSPARSTDQINQETEKMSEIVVIISKGLLLIIIVSLVYLLLASVVGGGLGTSKNLEPNFFHS